VFDIETSRQLWQVPRVQAFEQAATFAGNDRVVTVDQKRTIEVREARSGKLLQKLKQQTPAEVLAAAPDGRWLATLEHHVHAIDKYLDKEVIHLWNLATGTERHQLTARPKRWYMNLLFTPDSTRLLSSTSGLEGFELTVWDVQSGQRLHELRNVVGQHMAVSQDCMRLAAGSNWGKFAVFDLRNGQRLSEEVSHDLQTAAVSLSADGGRALITGYASMSTWDVATNRQLQLIDLPGNWSMDPYRIHSPDLRYALSVVRHSEKNETQILVWDVAAGKRLHTFPFPGQWSQLATAFSPDSANLVVWQPGKESVIRFWDVRSGTQVHSFKEAKAGWPGHLFFAPDGKTLVVADRRTVAYDAVSGKELFSWRLEPVPDKSGMQVQEVGANATPQERRAWRSLVVSPEATVAACILDGGFDRRPLPDRIVLCDAQTGRIIRRWSDSGKPGNGYEELAFSPDGRLLASSDGTIIHVWEADTGKELRNFAGHRGEIRSLSFSANGRRLASASNDSTVLIWDLAAASPARNPDAKAIAEWWEDLARDDARQADAAAWHLAEVPTATVALLGKNLRPVPESDMKKMLQHIEDLDSVSFKVRQAASTELEKLGNAAAPALREALAKKPSLEVRQRVERLLDRSANSQIPPTALRQHRALRVLELIGSTEACRLLQELAAGAERADQTREAKASLRRLDSLKGRQN
ncbi:MAG TPA: hypothetical protein VGY58_21765, partial [Gemmataceae bacterium]|nr:hypothetical protein [Gemmataceae bacterium]